MSDDEGESGDRESNPFLTVLLTAILIALPLAVVWLCGALFLMRIWLAAPAILPGK